MLIYFSVENFRSYGKPATFTMIAAKGQGSRKDKDTLGDIPGSSAKLLPITAIYGGNASGKSNLVKAIAHMQHMVLHGKCSTLPFELDEDIKNSPSCFSIGLLANKSVYKYSIKISGTTIINENLTKIHGLKEMEIFARYTDTFSLSDQAYSNEDTGSKLRHLGDSLNAEALFLHTVCQNFRNSVIPDDFRAVYDWFQHRLKIMNSRNDFEFLFDSSHDEVCRYAEELERADTGIHGIRVDVKTVEANKLGFDTGNPDGLGLPDRAAFQSSKGLLVFDKSDQNNYTVRKYFFEHRDSKGNMRIIPFNDESEGSVRLLNLLPAVLPREDGGDVYVIDEMDRSLHPLLCEYLVKLHLDQARRGTGHQLIFTTHNVLLMRASLLRKDELWAVERDTSNASTLIPFSDYRNLREYGDIVDSYLSGRMGGIPEIY